MEPIKYYLFKVEGENQEKKNFRLHIVAENMDQANTIFLAKQSLI